MSDTLTAPTGAASVAPTTPGAAGAPAAPSTVAEAGAALKNAGSWDDLNFGGMDVIEDAPETPAESPESVPSPDEGPEFVQNAQGQWHRPDGTFANAEEIAQIEAQLAAPTETPAVPPADAPTATPATTVKLRTRDGGEREVQVDDPEIAQLIQQNFNDGMRRKEYAERVAVVEAKLEQLTQIDALLDTNPEAFVERSLTPEQKIRLASMLLAEHFDELVPIIQAYDTTPGERIKTTAAAQQRIREQEKAFTARTQAQTQAAALRGAVESLIPESIAPETADAFWADASTDLQRAIARGDKVEPATVPALLANRLKLYGIEAQAGAIPPATQKPRITLAPAPTSTTPAVAQPANEAAQQLADATKVKDKQRRIRLQQRDRANAAAVPPAGAGAAPVRLPPVPKGATIEEAAKAMKQHRNWTS